MLLPLTRPPDLMNSIFAYLEEYYRQADKWLLAACAAFAGLLIIANYRYSIETGWLYALGSPLKKWGGFYALYAIAFVLPYLAILYFRHPQSASSPLFWILLLVSPAIFALKVSFPSLSQLFGVIPASWQKYAAVIADLPFRFVLVALPLLLFRWWTHYPTLWGFTTRNFNAYPYALMLLIMIPLIAFAATQHDFLHVYPKVKQVAFIGRLTSHPAWYRTLFELSYGVDFLTIEFFFRGFLVLAFVRYAGPDAILPMAVFYCSIHFGKPLFECISSFFGGMLLGIIAYKTKSVLGGIMVHLGIAWMMEIGGGIGNFFKK